MLDRTLSSDKMPELLDQLRKGGMVWAEGLWGSAAPLLAAAACRALDRTILYITAHIDQADQVQDDLDLLLGGSSELLPAWESLPPENLGADEIACASAESVIGAADICLICGELPEDTVVAAIRTAELHRTKVILETPLQDHHITKAADLTWPMEYYAVDVLIPNFYKLVRGAELGAGSAGELKLIASELVARGIGCVLIKMPPREVFIVDRSDTTHVPWFDLGIVDHTASSDAFAGALAASCAVGDEPKDAVKFACAAGALAMSNFGTQDSLPKKEKIIELLQQHGD